MDIGAEFSIPLPPLNITLEQVFFFFNLKIIPRLEGKLIAKGKLSLWQKIRKQCVIRK